MAPLDANLCTEALKAHESWLAQCLENLLHLLILDRFADFASDQVSNFWPFFADENAKRC